MTDTTMTKKYTHQTKDGSKVARIVTDDISNGDKRSLVLVAWTDAELQTVEYIDLYTQALTHIDGLRHMDLIEIEIPDTPTPTINYTARINPSVNSASRRSCDDNDNDVGSLANQMLLTTMIAGTFDRDDDTTTKYESSSYSSSYSSSSSYDSDSSSSSSWD